MARHGLRRSARAADHLANERTFLAWTRTAVGLVAVGIVVDKFSLFARSYGRPFPETHLGALVGGALTVLGGLIAGLALAHFLDVRARLRRGVTEPDPALAVGTGVAVVLAAALLTLLILRG
jgi:putative membrane protein